MAEEPLTDCPVCDGHIRRVVNSVGIVFKGSGFYITDNRNGSSANGKNKTASGQTDEKTETKTKSKSDDAVPDVTKPKSKKKTAVSAN